MGHGFRLYRAVGGVLCRSNLVSVLSQHTC